MLPNMPRAFFALCLGALCCGACGEDPVTTSPSTTTKVRTTEVFTGTLTVGGAQFYSFLSSESGTTDVTLVSLRPSGSTASTLATVVGLGVGTPSGIDCALMSAITTAPGLAAQLSVTTSTRTYCVKVADVGNLRGATDYTVRLLHP